jgi:hypothetical protein
MIAKMMARSAKIPAITLGREIPRSDNHVQMSSVAFVSLGTGVPTGVGAGVEPKY